MTQATHHIHANHFGAELPTSAKALHELGFKSKRAEIIINDKAGTLWLISHQDVTRKTTS